MISVAEGTRPFCLIETLTVVFALSACRGRQIANGQLQILLHCSEYIHQIVAVDDALVTSSPQSLSAVLATLSSELVSQGSEVSGVLGSECAQMCVGDLSRIVPVVRAALSSREKQLRNVQDKSEERQVRFTPLRLRNPDLCVPPINSTVTHLCDSTQLFACSRSQSVSNPQRNLSQLHAAFASNQSTVHCIIHEVSGARSPDEELQVPEDT